MNERHYNNEHQRRKLMELISVQVGTVQTHQHNDSDWITGYVKKPIQGLVHVGKLHIEGDEQQHTKFHGGEHRVVLMYAADHYAMWQSELDKVLPYGSFAENFTVTGLNEESVCIGDIYQIGESLQVQVAQPRQPCNQIYKALGIRGIVKKVQATYRSGWYCRVLHVGDVAAGMSITRLERLHPEWTIAQAHDVMTHRADQPENAHKLAEIEALEPSWRKKLARTPL